MDNKYCPRPDFAREDWFSLNGEWDFEFEEKNWKAGYGKLNFLRRFLFRLSTRQKRAAFMTAQSMSRYGIGVPLRFRTICVENGSF